MKGQPLSEPQIRSFKRWLTQRAADNSGHLTSQKTETVNAIMRGAAQFEDWCARYALVRHGHHSRLVDVRAVQKEFWKDAQSNVPYREFAEDYTEEEILEIEQYFRSLAFSHNRDADNRANFRNYVMWRMSIEYGLRISEMLAFRMVDLPTREAKYIKIVRVEERDDAPDPRGQYSPRPKTLSRDLGTYFANSSFPDLFSKYVAEYRFTKAVSAKTGRERRRINFSHPYLFISNTGSPLARSSAQRVAKVVSCDLGIEFKWHRARHSFFNRIYAAADRLANSSDRERARQQMKYWGGWSSDESLLIYTHTARRNSARAAAFDFSQPSEKPFWGIL